MTQPKQIVVWVGPTSWDLAGQELVTTLNQLLPLASNLSPVVGVHAPHLVEYLRTSAASQARLVIVPLQRTTGLADAGRAWRTLLPPTFKALRALLREYPSSQFLFLAPLPTLRPRPTLGEVVRTWYLRRALGQLPNGSWLATPNLLRANRQLFPSLGQFHAHVYRVIGYYLVPRLAQASAWPPQHLA